MARQPKQTQEQIAHGTGVRQGRAAGARGASLSGSLWEDLTTVKVNSSYFGWLKPQFKLWWRELWLPFRPIGVMKLDVEQVRSLLGESKR